MDEFHIFLENTVISTLGKRLSCRHRSRKEKREESSEEGEAKRHKVLDDRDADKIKEDRRELNTKRESVLKDWLENLNLSGRFISCVIKNVGELYFSGKCPVGTYFPDNDRCSIHYPAHCTSFDSLRVDVL